MTMTREEVRLRQAEIIAALGVQPEINVQNEIEKRVNFLYEYLVASGAKGFVLGISGGQDSGNAAMLGKMAVERRRLETGSDEYKFVAMRLPYGKQADEDDAQAVLELLRPHEVITYNIKPAVDVAYAVQLSNGVELSDFVKGNRKARERMLAQYDIAAQYGLLVIGTDHAAEAITGFYTKFGDGACDITPLSTLNKRQGRALGRAMGNLPEIIFTKDPTADLLDGVPQRPDENELGLTYDQIDDFLEGKDIDLEAAEKLINQYDKTQHKRSPIPGI